MRTLNVIAAVLLIIGGLNWGLMGFFQYNLIAAIFGGNAAVVSRIIYALVGVSAVYAIFGFPTYGYGRKRGVTYEEERGPTIRAA